VKQAVRIVCLILAAIMLLGVVFSLFAGMFGA
jgi:hypothetical protein